MSLIHWDPFAVLSNLQSVNTDAREFSLTTDIHEDPTAYYFDLEVPGLTEKDIQVKLDKNVLSIEGERKVETEHKDREAYRLERSYGKFSRSFILPEIADAENVEAKYKNGVLQVRVAKKEIAKPKQIEVKLAS